MDMTYYQRAARKTAIYPGQYTFNGLVYCTLKLAGETGKFSEHVGKAIRDDFSTVFPERQNKMIKELGDVLWYVSQCAHELGFNLSDIAKANLDKLAERAKNNKLHGEGSER